MKTSLSRKGYSGAILGLFCIFFLVFATASESRNKTTFQATDSAGIVWVLEETAGSIVVSRSYPNGVTISVRTDDVMCNRLESDTQAVTTMDLEISEIYFLFHKHLDKVSGETQYRIHLSQDKRSQLSLFKNVKGDICLSN